MTASFRKHFHNVFAQLESDGFLLLSDAKLPNVSRMIAGESLRGSWWSNDNAHTIFAVGEMLEDHPDVMIMKLISGKVTFVHRELWNHIYSIGVAREDWQLKNLSASAKQLLASLDNEGTIQKSGQIARELESRLLVHAEQIHTESGKHAKVLETWPAWAKRAGFRARASDPVAARRFIETRLAEINKKHNARGTLPWPPISS